MHGGVVLITGQLLTDAVWKTLRTAAPDLDAHSADQGSDDSIAAMATRLLAMAPARFALVAHAMGGFIAFEVMRRAPDRVTRLALIATLASADGPAQTARRQSYIDLVNAGRFEQVVEERIPLLFPPHRRADAALLGLARRMAADTGAERFLMQQRAIMARVDSRPDLPRIAVPTLVMRGADDGITTAAHAAEIADAIPDARSLEIPATGHLPTIEAPAIAVPALLAFLNPG